jgi:hypothetical protein
VGVLPTTIVGTFEWRRTMRAATIVREKGDPKKIHIRISSDDEPQKGGEVELVEVIHQKDGETLEQFKERVVKFVREQIS